MEFKKYSSIENSYRIEMINRIEEMGLTHADVEWVATEKIHGANASLWYDGDEYKFAKRGSFLDPNDKTFYGCQRIVDELKPNVKELYRLLGDVMGAKEITICGELCGGHYPHKEVTQSNEKMIQKGIFYSPKHEFFAFDVFVDGKLLDYFAFITYVNLAEFNVAPLVEKGTFQECLEHSNIYNSCVSDALGLPRLTDDDGDNIVEGNVIKPIMPLFYGNGSRIILKNKNDKWTEKSRKKKRVWKPQEPLTEEVQEYLDTMLSYVTENRLRNVLSKIGTVTDKDFGKIQGLFAKDSIVEFMKESDGGYSILDKVDRKRVQKELSKTCATLVRNNFVNIIDNNF